MANFIIQYGDKQKELTADTSSITLETNGLYMENNLVFTKGDAEEYTLTYNGQTHTFAENTTLITTGHIMATDLQVSAIFVTDTNFLTFESESSFNLQFNSSAYTNTDSSFMEYKVPGENWQILAPGISVEAKTNGTKYMLYLRGTGFQTISQVTSTSSYSPVITLQGTNVQCKGNIEVLLDYKQVADGLHPKLASYAFANLFYGCTALITAPSLNSTQIASYSYLRMFADCVNLQFVPDIPADTMSKGACQEMFSGCTNIQYNLENPRLKASLGMYCYYKMFYNCSHLNLAPKLPIAKLKTGCYEMMFRNCTALINPPSVSGSTTTLAERCCRLMFAGCTSLTSTPAFSFTGTGSFACTQMFYECSALQTIRIRLSNGCGYTGTFAYMFSNCISLKQILNIHDINMARQKYYYMYAGCTALKLYRSGNYSQTYRIPVSGTLVWGEDAGDAGMGMFYDTGGHSLELPSNSSSWYCYVADDITIVG